MKQQLVNIAAGVSLLLCVATLLDRVVQARYFHWVELAIWKWNGPEQVVHGVAITGRSGILIFSAYAMGHQKGKARIIERHFNYGIEREEPDFKLTGAFLSRSGFRWEVDRLRSNPTWADTHNLVLPTWFCAMVFSILPAIWLARRREMARRRTRGLCLNCGYNLRATPERCPECGAIPAAPKGTAA